MRSYGYLEACCDCDLVISMAYTKVKRGGKTKYKTQSGKEINLDQLQAIEAGKRETGKKKGNRK